MTIYDLIVDRSGKVTRYNQGIIEKTLGLSLATVETIRMVKVKGAEGRPVWLRYAYTPETEHLNHTAEEFEKYIDKYWERF